MGIIEGPAYHSEGGEGEADVEGDRTHGRTGSVPMIGLDTNVFVRYFTQDDPAQSKRATTFIESH